MARTYILTHSGANGRPEVCREQVRYFKRIRKSFETLEWPTGEGSGLGVGNEEIATTKQRLDYSQLRFPALFLNGHGILHGRTFFLVDAAGENLDYFQLDQHGDLSWPEEGTVDCSTHAARTSRLEHVKTLNVLGINPFGLVNELGFFDGDCDTGLFNFSPSPALSNPKVRVYLGEEWRQSCIRANRVKNIYYNPEEDIARIEKYGRKYLRKREFRPDKTRAHYGYISVDLDVIRDFPSGWKGGLWGVEKVIAHIRQIAQAKRIIGADICGLTVGGEDEQRVSEERKERALEQIAQIHDTLRGVMMN